MGAGIVSLILCLFAGFPLCCFLFEPFAFKEHCVQARDKEVQFEYILIEVCLVPMPRMTLQKYYFPP